MKRNIFLLFGIVLLTVLYGCKDDGFAAVENPVQTGDEIIFGSRLSGNTDIIDSKTVYGDRTTTGVPVYWKEDGSDEIAIYCLQSSQPADHLVHYKVMPETQDLNGDNIPDKHQASSVTKVNTAEAGLQWGDLNKEHRFYAFYPASAVKGSDEENETGMITASIPENQQVTEWITKDAGQAGAINGKRTYFGLPDMNYAYMYAYTAVDPSKTGVDTPVNLTFKNLVTVVDITVQGPATGEITITNINVDAVDGADIALAGDFTCNIRATNETGSDATCEAIANDKVRNRISIPCYDKTENKFITLKQDEYLNVKAYLIPDDNEDHIIHPQQLKITVSTLNGAAKSKKLQTADIVPHKINRVILPPLVEEGTNYWMSNLDPDIYISELSIPGSKQSFATSENNASEIFQGYPLETQFKDGVRAFIVQTNINTTYERGGFWPSYTYNVTGATVNESNTDVDLETILGQLKTLLDEAQQNNKMNEFAFVQITYNSASSSSYYTPGGGAFQYWIEGIEYELNKLIQEGNLYNIYTDQITPDTRLGDVGGHIVLKVNYNDGQTGMGQYIAADATIPALFSTWTKGMDDVDLYWGSPNSNQTGRPEMRWYYSEATHIGNSNEAADITVKKNQISTVFQESVNKYLKGTEHNYWFMNDVGGCYSTGSPTTPTLTEDLNNYAVELLQGRTQNASLGIVLLNYADKQKDSGALYQSDWLIQTIIDNNFKFALRKASSASPSPVITNTRNGVSEDGWDD